MLLSKKPLRFFTLCIAGVFCTALASQELRRVAIPEAIGQGANVTQFQKNVARSTLTEYIVNSSTYRAVDRLRTDELFKEHAFQREGLVDREKVKELGKILQADLVCVTYLSREGDYINVEASVIDVVSGEIFNSASELISGETPDAIKKGVTELAKRLLRIQTTKDEKILEVPIEKPVEKKPPPSEKNHGLRNLVGEWEGTINGGLLYHQLHVTVKVLEERNKFIAEVYFFDPHDKFAGFEGSYSASLTYTQKTETYHLKFNRWIDRPENQNGFFPHEFKGTLRNNIFAGDVMHQFCPYETFMDRHQMQIPRTSSGYRSQFHLVRK